MPANGEVHEGGRRKLTGWIVGVAIALVASLTATALVLLGVIPGLGGSSSDELVLEGAEEPGAAAFMVADLVNPSSLITPIKKGEAIPAIDLTPQPVNGATPGLYGGSGTETCNPGQLVSFLGQNPDKAAAWVAALNADPDLRWGTGQPLTVAEIPVYVANLIPTVLQADTWVTNHGFSGNVATPFQSMLQRGTSVLVDRFGVPRARCLCGNPLLPPKAIDTPKPAGDPWEGFGDPPQTVTPEPEPIDELEVVDEHGNLVKVTSEFCASAKLVDPAAACPSPGPDNATAAGGPPAPDPGTDGTATNDPGTDAVYIKDSPATPSVDICANFMGQTVTNGSGTSTFDATNNSPVEVDIWSVDVTWAGDVNGGVIDSCTAIYVNTLRKGATSDYYGWPGATWYAFETEHGTGPVATKVNDGSAWSIS